MKTCKKIGFIQGRLSSLVDGKIQAFPSKEWKDEFKKASLIGLTKMEWTLDYIGLRENPLLTEIGRGEIKCLMKEFNITIPSLTGDNFMQNPFWKATGNARESLLEDLSDIVLSSESLGIHFIVIPLVDNGSLEDEEQIESLIDGLSRISDILKSTGIAIVFESDFPPNKLKLFIDRFEPTIFGINYDIGNSASLGFDPVEEIDAYGTRILNVHVKDRIFGGGTVPLGDGDAVFESVFQKLSEINYDGNFILQTARATNGDHSKVLSKYMEMTSDWIEKYES